MEKIDINTNVSTNRILKALNKSTIKFIGGLHGSSSVGAKIDEYVFVPKFTKTSFYEYELEDIEKSLREMKLSYRIEGVKIYIKK